MAKAVYGPSWTDATIALFANWGNITCLFGLVNIQIRCNLVQNCVKVPSMYLANYSIRGTVLLASFFMAAGSGIR